MLIVSNDLYTNERCAARQPINLVCLNLIFVKSDYLIFVSLSDNEDFDEYMFTHNFVIEFDKLFIYLILSTKGAYFLLLLPMRTGKKLEAAC